MNITVNLESIGRYSTGGGYRTVERTITIDDTQERVMQQENVLFETLGAILDYTLSEEQIHEIALLLNYSLLQLQDAWENQQ